MKKIQIDQLQPTQIYLSDLVVSKVSLSMADLSAPVKVADYKGRYILLTGHARCFILLALGISEIEIEVVEKEFPLEAYELCADEAIKAGVTTINDLEDKIVSGDDFKRLWVERCKSIHSLGTCLRNNQCERCHLEE